MFVHEAASDDILRDRDAVRRGISLSKLGKFQRLDRVTGLTKEELEHAFGRIQKPNDLVDATLQIPFVPRPDASGMLVILPRSALGPAIRALLG